MVAPLTDPATSPEVPSATAAPADETSAPAPAPGLRWRGLRCWAWRWLRRLGMAVRLLILVLLGDLAGFIWFAVTLPPPVESATEKVDGIVVLTGGALRVVTGLRLLSDGVGQRLLISGVNRDVVLPEILAPYEPVPAALTGRIDLDYRAGDTYGNAAETASWVRRHGFRSIVLVTASYHMPRALLELRGRLNGVRIVPHPVHPSGFGGAHWWQRADSLALVAAEYHKALGAWARQLLWPDRL